MYARAVGRYLRRAAWPGWDTVRMAMGVLRRTGAWLRAGDLPVPTSKMWAADICVAVLLAAYATLYVSGTAGPHQDRHLALALIGSLALGLRRRFPLAVLLVVLVVSLGLAGNAAPRAMLLIFLIATYSAARYSPHRIPALVTVVLGAAMVFQYFGTALPDIPGLVISFAILIPLALAADVIRTGRMRAEEDKTRLRELEGRQEKETREAVARERARIARELHDVVTHNVSVMLVQAGAARKIMDASPADAREALLAVEASGRSAMAELRQVMGLLAPATDQVDLAPQPGIDQLPALVDRVRATGTSVDLAVTGAVRPVPAGIDLAAYRVVQEALTNTVKHAAGAAATVLLDYGAGGISVTVTDTGGSDVELSGNGRGLIGLRERLAVYGGSLEAGSVDTGYRVRAVIPVEAT